MARTFRPTTIGRLRDRLIGFTLRRGFGPPGLYLLTVAGRKTGTPHSTPIALLENGADRWLVGAFGEVDWVRNARAAGRVSLRRGRTDESLAVTELPADEAAPLLKRYVTEHARTVGAYFDAGKDAPVEEFTAEAARHPVFRLESAGG